MASPKDEEFEWHGWGTSDGSVPSLHVGHLPGRKSLCLYSLTPNVLVTLAFFRDEDSAKEALTILDRLMETPRA